MAADKILLVDKKNTNYVFCSNGDIIIDGKLKGKGKVITDITKISLRQPVDFILEHKPYKTLPLKAAAVND